MSRFPANSAVVAEYETAEPVVGFDRLNVTFAVIPSGTLENLPNWVTVMYGNVDGRK